VDRGEPRTIQITVHGDVQGVGFRWFTRRVAESLGVVGTVANQRDGTVRIVARGSQDTLARFQSSVREGPPYAVVTRLEIRELSDSYAGSGFEIVH
jgi:acylphosphatase